MRATTKPAREAPPRYAPRLARDAQRKEQRAATGAPTASRSDGRRLKLTLIGLDSAALAVAWAVALTPAWRVREPDVAKLAVAIAGIVVASAIFARAQRLYLSRICVVRAQERARLLRLTAFSTAAAVVFDAWLGLSATWRGIAIGAALALVLLLGGRSSFRHWIMVQRLRGRFVRTVVVLGDNEEAEEIVQLLHHQPELGFRAIGYVGRPPIDAPAVLAVPWLGPTADAERIVDDSGVTGVLVMATAHGATDLKHLVRAMLRTGTHVQLSTGLYGVAQRRLRPFPLSYEPMFYVEPGVPSRWTLATKRAMDVVLGVVLGIVALPLLAAAAIAIKLGDFGPVIFKQERVGRFGKPFKCYKLRTMRPGSDARLAEVLDRNTRLDSPLFKDPLDPRRTRVGRVLEATSLDELPQLWNVLRGEMSLVGPRPALVHEVAQFDDEMLERHNVRPGITGLWQVESRENPHFRPYRRLDLMYVENLSIWLDLAVLSTTLQIVLVRALRRIVLRRSARAVVPAAQAMDAK
jgi:exopolysaccharide biosynthesis polyprenyl glycosylphosphotransferase